MNKQDIIFDMDIFTHSNLRYFELHPELASKHQGRYIHRLYEHVQEEISFLYKTVLVHNEITDIPTTKIIYEDVPLEHLHNLYSEMKKANDALLELCSEMKIATKELRGIQKLWATIVEKISSLFGNKHPFKFFSHATDMQDKFADQEAILNSELGVNQ